MAKEPISSAYTPDTQTFSFTAVDTFPYIVEITDLSSEVAFVKITPAVADWNPENNTNGTSTPTEEST